MSVDIDNKLSQWNLDYTQGKLSLTELLSRLDRKSVV